MKRLLKILFIFILFIVISPGIISAKTHSDVITKNVMLSGGSSINDIATVDKDFIESLKIVNDRKVESKISLGGSGAIYYSKNELPEAFSKGAYGFKVSKGTDSDLGYNSIFQDQIKLGNKTYDVSLSIKSVADEGSGIFLAADDKIHLELGKNKEVTSEDRNKYHSMDLSIDIYEQGTKNHAKIPGLVFAVNDIDGNEITSEGVKIHDFSSNKNNTFIKSKNSTVMYNNGSYYGTTSVSDPIGGRGDVFFKIPQLENEGRLDITYASTVYGVGAVFYFFMPSHEINYVASEGGEITGIRNTTQFKTEFVLGSAQKEKIGYKFLHWTCDKDVTIEDKEVKKGDPISNSDLTKIEVLEDLTFTSFYEKKKYNIKTSVVNGKIDKSIEALYGDDKIVSYNGNKGYNLKSIIVDGESINLEENPKFYTFENIDKDHEIIVEYEKIENSIKKKPKYTEKEKEPEKGLLKTMIPNTFLNEEDKSLLIILIVASGVIVFISIKLLVKKAYK